ncbi:alpha/beta fold hydrolase [Chromobacterium violaceum]|nr:alpha/beta hydrolase [Chromobacterium violaceum]
MTPSSSQYLTLNRRRHHLRRWGPEHAPLLILLHGWMDSSATFQFMVDALSSEWQVVAPDWRGFGDSQWNDGSYYFPDYLADLDDLLRQLSPGRPVNLLGHSMGAMIAGIYAGVCPQRIEKLVLAEGFGLNPTRPSEAPGRYGRWLRETSQSIGFEPMASLEQAANKLVARNPMLTPERARWLAAELTRPVDGGFVYRADPATKWSIRSCTGWRKRWPAGAASPRRCYGCWASTRSTTPSSTTCWPRWTSAAPASPVSARRQWPAPDTCCNGSSQKAWQPCWNHSCWTMKHHNRLISLIIPSAITWPAASLPRRPPRQATAMVIELDHVQPEQLLQNLAIPSCPGILDRLRALRDDSAPPGGAGLAGREEVQFADWRGHLQSQMACA